MSDQSRESITEYQISPVEHIEQVAEADSSQVEFDQHRSISREMQAACDAVVDARLGQDPGAITQRLKEELERRGHWPQPKPWVDAVVAEVQLGHHYRV